MTECYEKNRRVAAGAVSWARPVYVTEPAEAWEPGDVVDVEFHNRPEKPAGEGWRPLVLADTNGAAWQIERDEALLRQALEALEYYRSGEDYQPTPASEAITAIKERLK